MGRVFLATNGRGLARAESGAEGQWAVERKLDGVNVRCLSADPRTPHVVYAGTQGDGVLRSEDRGRTWQPAGLEGQIVKSIAASPVESGVVYAGTKPPAIFVSHDSGRHWAELESFRGMRRWWWFTPAEPPFTQPYVQGLALSPTDPDVILAGIEYGNLLRSADGGRTWTGHQKGALHDCHSLTFHPTNGDWAYQGGGEGAAYSRDAGITWVQPDPLPVGAMLRSIFVRRGESKGGLIGRYGWAAAGDPARPDVAYCATAPGPGRAHGGNGNAEAHIYRCQAGGVWERLAGGLPQPLDYMPYALICDRDAPGHLYAGLSNGDVWHTADYGDSWQPLPVNLGTVWATMVML